MIMQLKIIILDELHPSPLPQIQVSLCKQILQTLVVREHLELLTIKVVPPDFQGKDHSC